MNLIKWKGGKFENINNIKQETLLNLFVCCNFDEFFLPLNSCRTVTCNKEVKRLRNLKLVAFFKFLKIVW